MMAQSISDRAKKFVDDTKNAISSGDKQTSGLGNELAERARMNQAGQSALSGGAPAPAKGTAATSPSDKVNGAAKYGDRPGEKRLDMSKLPDGTPAPVFHKGVASVPKTGPAILQKGEKVVKASDNPDNPENDNDSDDKERTPEEKAHFHRAMTHLHTGGLHRHLGIEEGKPIPMAKKKEAAGSDNPHVAAMGRLAVAMAGWKHPKK